MRPGVTANFVSELQSFQQPTLTCLEDQPSGAFSSVSKDGRICWVARGSLLEVLDVSSRARVAAWQFGRILGDQHTSITCIEEFSVGQSLKLIVGVCNSSPTGLLCVFDVALSKVVKAVDIPNPVTELEVVSTSVRNNVPRWALSEHLRYFCGLVAVGTAGGRVYLVDMCLDDNEFFSDEEVASKVHFIWPRNRDVENQRFHCMSQGLHLCMTLNESLFTRNGFEYQKPDGLVMKTFRADSVSVTSLRYVPQAGILVVGYSFGCFQLWKLHIPVLEYSSRLESEPLPVTHISYQEPENDPKNFCYLWVARGQLVTEENQGLDTVSTICLYQLAFNNKSFYTNYGVFYDELSSVCLRMDHELTCTPVQFGSNYDGGSRVVSCHTLADPHYQPPLRLGEDESFEESNHGPDLSLCVFVWEATAGSASSKVGRHLAIFDINRWYHAQMPAGVRFVSGSVDTCSYLSFCELDNISDQAIADNMLAIHVTADRLRKFVSNSPMPPEQHFYPASLAFDVKIVFESGIVAAQFLGSQRQVLANMETRGPIILVQPQDLYNMCIYVGLLPRTSETTAANPNLVYQREALLTLSLEYNMLSLIKACISQWASGEFEHQGCSLKFLLAWAWEKVSTTKHQIDTICVNLYNWSGLILDQRSIQTLFQCNQRLVHLISVFKTFSLQAGPVTQQGETELQSKILVTSLISQHLNVVLWFMAAGLLPENDDTEVATGSQYCYPATSLVMAYKKRRADLQSIHSDIGETDVLMIDGLVENLGIHDLWDREGGSGLYPPPSLHALLTTYLLEDVDMLSKHCLVLYLLLDLVSVDMTDETFSEKVSKFAQRFNLPPTLVKLVQAFWLLDHRDFEEALTLLLDPMVTTEFSRWQHKRIIKALLYQGDAKLAQRYITSVKPALTTPEEVKLRLTILLANGLTAEALEYQRQCRDEHNMQDLLSHLILGCQQTKTVDRLLQLPLSVQEEAILIDYLLESSEPQLHELLVMHYLQRARFVEAIQLNEKLKHSVLIESNAKARERAASRNAVVDKYASILPSVQRKLLFEQVHVPKKNMQWRREVRRPTPLSTKITKTKATVLSQSAFIMTIMEKLDEIEAEEPAGTDVHNKSVGPFICTPVTPARKSLRETPVTVYPESTGTHNGSRSNLSLHKSLRMFQNADTPPTSDRRQSKFYSASCLSLLQTPSVQRLTPKKQRLSSKSNVITPQSILKVKHMISTTSPSPHSSNVTPNSQELEGSLKKLPRKLGYGAALSQPGTPRSVSFSDPPLSSLPRHLSTEMAQTSSQPASPKSVTFIEPSESPVRLGRQSQPSTPKSVSFADSTINTAAKLKPLTTPKQLRFGSSKQGASTSVSRWSPAASPTGFPVSPDSPRSVKDRSPTPESSQFSPKLASKVDVLHRRPLRTTPTKEEELVLQMEESDDNISDDGVEEMDASSETADSAIDTSVASSATLKSPWEQDVSLSSQTTESAPPVTPQKSPSEKQPSSPTVKISKSPISIYSSGSAIEHAQLLSSSLEHATTLPAEKAENLITDNEPVNIDLTVSEDEDMEVGEEEMPVLEREPELTQVAKSKEIFEDEEEINPPGEIEESKEIFEADEEISAVVEIEEMADANIVSSTADNDGDNKAEAVTQEIKQERDEDDAFSEPPKPVRELEPPLPPEVDDKTLSPLRRKSLTPPDQRHITLVKKKYSPPDAGYGVQSSSKHITSPSPTKNMDSIISEINDKFADSPIMEEEEIKVYEKSVSGREVVVTETRRTRTRQKFNILPVKIEEVADPVTPSRSTRRKSRESSVPMEEPATPTRSSRRLRKGSGNEEVPTTPTRSTRRHQKQSENKQGLVEISIESPRKLSQKAKEAVQVSLHSVSMEIHSKSGASPERLTILKDASSPARTPTRSTKKQKNKNKENDKESSRTPTRSSRRHTDAVEQTTDKIDNIEEVINVETTPSRTRRHKKAQTVDNPDDIAESSTQAITPRRGSRKNVSPEKQSKSPSRNKNLNAKTHSQSPNRRSMSPSANSSDVISGVQNILTPTRSGRGKKDVTLIENKGNTNENAGISPSRKSSHLLKEDTENIELTPSRRNSFGRSEIPVDFIENVEGTPSRRQSLGRSCKTTVEEQQISTPTRRRSLGRSVKDKDSNNTAISTPVKVAPSDTEAPLTPSKTPVRQGRSKKNESSPNLTQVLTPSRKGRSYKGKSEPEISAEDNVHETNVSQTVAVTPSRRGRSNKLKSEPDISAADVIAEKVHEADVSQSTVVTPSRRGRSKKVKVLETESSLPAESTKDRDGSPPLTPSRSKRLKKEKKEDSSPSGGIRSHDKDGDVEMSTSTSTVMPDLYDIHSSSFQFSDPMQVDGAEESVVQAKSFTPVKSFIFSPPIQNARLPIDRTRPSVEQPAGLKEEGILLPPGPSLIQVTEKKKTRTRTKKLYSEKEEILLISPSGVVDQDNLDEEGRNIVTRTTRAAVKKVQTKKDGTKLLVQSITDRKTGFGRQTTRKSHRFGPLGQKQ